MISVSSAEITDNCLARNGYAYPISSTNFNPFDPRYVPSLKVSSTHNSRPILIPCLPKLQRPQASDTRRNTRSDDDQHSQTSTLWLHRKKRSVSRPATDKTSLRTHSTCTRSSIWDDASTVYHSSAFGFEFDSSCLHFLDDQLILNPTDSFADVCWADAVHDDLLDESYWVMSPLPQRSSSDDESDEEGSRGSTNVSGATGSTETLQDWCSDDDSMDGDLKKRVHFVGFLVILVASSTT